VNSFADTNWLEAIYFEPDPNDRESVARSATVERRMRVQSGPLLISHIVLLEARNVFGRLSGVAEPKQWQELVGDFSGRIFVDTMNWGAVRGETNRLFERFSHRTVLGTFDATLIASALLAGPREILSFDEKLKAVAAAVGLKVFPALGPEGKTLVSELKRR
jgi:predicted nucleic acid-binding protein